MAIARVQSTSGSTINNTAATLVLTLGAATTAGNVVLVGVNVTSSAIIKVTSTHGIFSDVTPSGLNTTSSNAVHLFLGIMSGADTAITISVFGNARMVGIAAEYSGSHLTPADIPTNSQSNTATPNVGAITNSVASSLYIAALGQKGFDTGTTNTTWASGATNSFNIVAQNTTNANGSRLDLALTYLDSIVSTSAARNTSVVSAFGALNASGILATFSEITAGGGLRAAGHGGLAA